MKTFFSFFICMIFMSHNLVAQSTLKISAETDFSIGKIIEIDSEILGEKRIVNIYLPNGYSDDSPKQYPVIYLLDGSADEDFIHIAGIVQFGSFSWINMIPETIIVGIGNIDRKKDFTFPTTNEKDKLDFPTTGKSENFMNFIESELQPLIDKRFKTTKTKTIIGQSLGGLLATEILFKRPDLFDNYIIISPSLWWDDESLLKFDPVKYTTQKSIYIGSGKEGELMERLAKDLHQKLAEQKKDNTKLFNGYFEKLIHGDVLHLSAYDALEKIFRVEEK